MIIIPKIEETDDYIIHYYRKVPEHLPKHLEGKETHLESRVDNFPTERNSFGRLEIAGATQTINEDLPEEYPFRVLEAKEPLSDSDAEFFKYRRRPVAVKSYTGKKGTSKKPTHTRPHTRRKPRR